MNKINDKESILIRATQVYSSLASVLKELIENSIDASSTNIEIKLKNHGLDNITVIDNGQGITKEELENYIGKTSHTSKLNFENMKDDEELLVEKLGFRGEALSLLCFIAKLKIITASDSEEAIGNMVRFEYSSTIKEKGRQARQKGTTTIVEEIYSNIKMRRTYFMQKIKHELYNLIQLVINFAVINTKIRFILKNETTKNKKETTLLKTMGTNSLESSIKDVYGLPLFETLLKFDQKLSFKNNGSFVIYGYISIPSLNPKHSSKNLKMIYLNKRICKLQKIIDGINDVYKSIVTNTKYFLIMDIVIDKAEYDVNLSPDKRTVALKHINQINTSIKDFFENFLNNNSRIKKSVDLTQKTLPVLKSNSLLNNGLDIASSNINTPSTSQPHFTDSSLYSSPMNSQYPQRHMNTGNPTDHSIKLASSKALEMSSQSIGSEEQTHSLHISSKEDHTSQIKTEFQGTPKKTASSFIRPIEDASILRSTEYGDYKSFATKSQPSGKDFNCDNLNIIPPKRRKVVEDFLNNHSVPKNNPASETSVLINDSKPEIFDLETDDWSNASNKNLTFEKNDPIDVIHAKSMQSSKKDTLLIDFQAMKEKYIKNYNEKKGSKQENVEHCTQETENYENVDPYEIPNIIIQDMKNQTLNKNELKNSHVIGQFNHGFILVYIYHKKSIFVVDQHAINEKEIFMKLINNTQIKSQPLIRPNITKVSTIEKLNIEINTNYLTSMGFRFELDNNNNLLKLYATPVMNNCILTRNDFDEIINSLSPNKSNTKLSTKDFVLKIPKIKLAFATKACRSAIMIGQELNRLKMIQLVKSFYQIDHPWNCPHGRPTIAFLCEHNAETS